jgi:hypothetical protein
VYTIEGLVRLKNKIKEGLCFKLKKYSFNEDIRRDPTWLKKGK